MSLATILSLLMPLIEHLVEHYMAKDTSKMSAEELAAHTENLACANGACEMVKKIKA